MFGLGSSALRSWLNETGRDYKGHWHITSEDHPSNDDEDCSGGDEPAARFKARFRQPLGGIAQPVGLHVLTSDPRDGAAPVS